MISIGPKRGNLDTREALARMLLSGGQQGGTGHWSDGLSRAGSMIAGALLSRESEKERTQQDAIRRDELARVLQGVQGAMTGRPASTQTYGDGTTIDWAAQGADPNRAASIAMGNPATAELGLTLMQGNRADQRFAEQTAAREAEAQQSRTFEAEQNRLQREFQERQREADRAAQAALVNNRQETRPVQTITTADGIFVVNPDGTTGNRLGNAPARDAGPMSPTAQKELFESEDVTMQSGNAIRALDRAMELNDSAYSGTGAEARAWLARNTPIGDDKRGADTTEFSNLITGQALESLKGTFGAAPTEGERQILMQLQAAPNLSPEERRRILTRARELAVARQQFNAQKAQQLREGTYFRPGGGSSTPQQPAVAAPATPSGLSPAEEQELAQLRARFGGRS